MEQQRDELKRQLTEIEGRLERALRLRGFNLQQVDNVPLTPEIEVLNVERKSILARIEQLQRKEANDDRG